MVRCTRYHFDLNCFQTLAPTYTRQQFVENVSPLVFEIEFCSLVAKHFRVPADKLHVETTGNSLTLPLEENYLAILKLIKLKTVQNRYGMPQYLRRDGIDPLIRIQDDDLTYILFLYKSNIKIEQLLWEWSAATKWRLQMLVFELI